jgi:hypothetical protein
VLTNLQNEVQQKANYDTFLQIQRDLITLRNRGNPQEIHDKLMDLIKMQDESLKKLREDNVFYISRLTFK